MPVEFKYTTEEFEYTVTVYDEEEETEAEEPNELQCYVCGRVFTTRPGLKQHQTVMEHND